MLFEVVTIPITLTTPIFSQEAIQLSESIEQDQDSRLIDFPSFYSCFAPIRTDPSVDIIKKLSSFKFLSENWDGKGGLPPEETVIHNSLKFVKSLPISVLSELSKDNIISTPYGTVVLDWMKGNKTVSVEIGENQIGFFSDFADNENPLSLDGVPFNENALPVELNSAFKKFFQKIAA